jgi:ribonuclease HII
MTPEEIAHMLLRGSSKYKVGLIELLCSDSASSDEMSAAEELIAQAIREARIEACGEAIRATCLDCRNGVPVTTLFCAPPVSERAYETRHKHADGHWTECAAASIHILFASLVEEVSA